MTIIDVLDKAERIKYELTKARRGSSGISGDDPKALSNTLIKLKEDLEKSIKEIERN